MLFKLLTAPFTSPVHGAVWLASEIRNAAERDINDPARIRKELDRLEQALEAGEITEEEFEEVEEQLILRLQAAGAD